MPEYKNTARPRALATIAASVIAAAGAMVALTGAAALPAPSHVRVEGDAEAGKSATVTFRVPNESNTASTVRLEVALPSETPITTVRTQSKPNWAAELVWSDLDTPITVGETQIERYESSIVWTAEGDGIAPGEFDEFVATIGAIPDQPELVLPVLQVYSDGFEQHWAEVSHGGGHDGVAYPAPVLEIGVDEAAGDDAIAFWIALVGVAIGVVGVTIAAVALSRTLSQTR